MAVSHSNVEVVNNYGFTNDSIYAGDEKQPTILTNINVKANSLMNKLSINENTEDDEDEDELYRNFVDEKPLTINRSISQTPSFPCTNLELINNGYNKPNDPFGTQFNGVVRNESTNSFLAKSCPPSSTFDQFNSMVLHIEYCHIDQQRYCQDNYTCYWVNCPRQNRSFNARYKLLNHMRIHSGEKPNKCPHPGCMKAFSRQENLKIHIRSHTGEKPYLCPIQNCNKAFSNSSDRAKHQRTHFHSLKLSTSCDNTQMSTLYNNNNSVSSSFNNMASSYSIGSANQMAPPSNGPISSIELGNLSKSWCVNGNNSTPWPQQAQNRLRMCNNNECVLRTNNEWTKMDSFQNQVYTNGTTK
ncbi:hypothetical protein RDWZM_002627 [Blomia tropicalis]|uniref:C2H2-type domain-containing protein n=1 Tax=Blomia tropicalis TaxID=40697 RepID=A0A9Q0MGG6_BLOTA|nr:hypothetical protein RDWZM_002627 [Blomia tropicalis]